MHEHIIQGTPEWHAIRLGKATGSRMADLCAKTKSGWGAGRANYAAELVAERLTGTAAEHFQSAEMRWGNEKEPEARALYEFRFDADIQTVGFVDHPTIAMAGCSPDGLVGTDGLVEFKCPNTATHIDTLLGALIPGRYMLQMQWEMACTGRLWCDFVSYDPRLPEAMRLSVKRVPRDGAAIVQLQQDVKAFLAEVAETVERLTGLYGARAAA